MSAVKVIFTIWVFGPVYCSVRGVCSRNKTDQLANIVSQNEYRQFFVNFDVTHTHTHTHFEQTHTRKHWQKPADTQHAHSHLSFCKYVETIWLCCRVGREETHTKHSQINLNVTTNLPPICLHDMNKRTLWTLCTTNFEETKTNATCVLATNL